jgi:chromosome segregation ATPase
LVDQLRRDYLQAKAEVAAVAEQAKAAQKELQQERAALRDEVEKLRAHLSERDAEMQRKLQELQTREQQSRAELEKQKSWTVAAAGDDAARAELAKAVAERGRIELELSTVRSPEAREARMAEFRAVDEKINQLTRQLDAKNAKIREEIAREILRDPEKEMKEEITAERATLVTELRGTSEQVSKLKAELKKFTAEKAALEADGAPAEVLAAKEAEVRRMREVLEQLRMQESIKEREIERHDFNALTRKPRRQ